MEYRVGHGIDIHRLVEGRRLFLGGIEIPHQLGLSGHSDADVLVHAVIDALLGASGQSDIGSHFPDNDPAWKDADSMKLLEKTWQAIKVAGWRVQNLDTNIIAEAPKLAGHIPGMKENLSRVLGVRPDQIAIKAGTNEGVGELGKGLAIQAHALVLLTR